MQTANQGLQEGARCCHPNFSQRTEAACFAYQSRRRFADARQLVPLTDQMVQTLAPLHDSSANPPSLPFAWFESPLQLHLAALQSQIGLQPSGASRAQRNPENREATGNVVPLRLVQPEANRARASGLLLPAPCLEGAQ